MGSRGQRSPLFPEVYATGKPLVSTYVSRELQNVPRHLPSGLQGGCYRDLSFQEIGTWVLCFFGSEVGREGWREGWMI